MSASKFATVSLGGGLLLFASILLFGGSAGAANFTVCHGGCPYESIQSAVTASAAGAIIAVAPGRYEETVAVNKPVTLLGPQSGAAADRTTDPRYEAIVIGAHEADSFVPSFYVTAPGVTIDGFILGPDAQSSDAHYAGVIANNVSDLAVRSSVVRNSFQGVGLTNVTRLDLQGDRFDADTMGIYGMRVTGATVGTVSPLAFNGIDATMRLIFEQSTGIEQGSAPSATPVSGALASTNTPASAPAATTASPETATPRNAPVTVTPVAAVVLPATGPNAETAIIIAFAAATLIAAGLFILGLRVLSY